MHRFGNELQLFFFKRHHTFSFTITIKLLHKLNFYSTKDFIFVVIVGKKQIKLLDPLHFSEVLLFKTIIVCFLYRRRYNMHGR